MRVEFWCFLLVIICELTLFRFNSNWIHIHHSESVISQLIQRDLDIIVLWGGKKLLRSFTVWFALVKSKAVTSFFNEAAHCDLTTALIISQLHTVKPRYNVIFFVGRVGLYRGFTGSFYAPSLSHKGKAQGKFFWPIPVRIFLAKQIGETLLKRMILPWGVSSALKVDNRYVWAKWKSFISAACNVFLILGNENSLITLM